MNCRPLLSLLIMVILASCFATAPKQTVAPAVVQVIPPRVSAAATLSFAGIFGEDSGIRSPHGLSFGMDGSLYVCDLDKSSVVRLDANGARLSHFDSYTNRTERLYSPVDVCSTSGIEIYVIDVSNARVIRLDRNLKNGFTIFRADRESRLFGSFGGIAFDPVSGDLYITDRDNGTVIRKDMIGGSVRSLGSFGADRKSLREPAGIDVAEDGTLYIADTGAGGVVKMQHFGAGMSALGVDVLEAPVDVCVLPGTFLAAADRHGIVLLDKTGNALAFAGFGTDRTMTPRSLVYRNDMLYVSDGTSGAILMYRVTLP